MAMIKHYIDVDSAWGVVLCYDFDLLDMDEMAAIMDSFGVEEEEIHEAMHVLLGINSGMTISRSDITMSVVFISKASSLEQFLDTLAHELDHVQDAVCRFYDVPQGSEDAAWLQGYLMRGASHCLARDGIFCSWQRFCL